MQRQATRIVRLWWSAREFAIFVAESFWLILAPSEIADSEISATTYRMPPNHAYRSSAWDSDRDGTSTTVSRIHAHSKRAKRQRRSLPPPTGWQLTPLPRETTSRPHCGALLA